MSQIHIDKDRSYRLGKGAALDAMNERFSADRKDGEALSQIHPTKGNRSFSPARLAAQFKVEASMHGWAMRAAQMTESSVGGEPREKNRQKYMPHQGKRECARRRGDFKRAHMGTA